MKIDELIKKIASDPNCRMSPPCGLPQALISGVKLSKDVQAFYKICGGLELFPNTSYGFRIVSPEEFVSANPVVLGGYYLKHKAEYDADESSGWYVVARSINNPNEIIAIDLNVAKSGFCYDGFWEVYGHGDSKVVAKSFTDLVESLFKNRGDYLFWEKNGFNLGHARD